MPAEEATATSSSASAGGSDSVLARLGAVFLQTAFLLGARAHSLGAQEEAPLRFNMTESGEAAVEVGNLLEDPGLLDAIQSGLPLRIRVHIQLWKNGFFDDLKGQYEWRASVLFDPLTRRYRVQTGAEEGAVTWNPTGPGEQF